MNDMSDIPAVMTEIGRRAKAAAAELAFTPPERKTQALEAAADAVWANRGAIVEAPVSTLGTGGGGYAGSGVGVAVVCGAG